MCVSSHCLGLRGVGATWPGPRAAAAAAAEVGLELGLAVALREVLDRRATPHAARERGCHHDRVLRLRGKPSTSDRRLPPVLLRGEHPRVRLWLWLLVRVRHPHAPRVMLGLRLGLRRVLAPYLRCRYHLAVAMWQRCGRLVWFLHARLPVAVAGAGTVAGAATVEVCVAVLVRDQPWAR